MRPNGPGRCWWPGTRWTNPRIGTRALADYQSGREFDTELVDQLEVLPEFVAACGFTNAKAPGCEAHDFLAAAVAKERRGAVVVATGDRDAHQLASAKTTILQPIKAGEMARIGPAEVRDRYGLEPAQVPDFIALRGDASDKIPGAKGVGPRTAAGLLTKYGSLENMLAAGRFVGQADELRLYRSIATMNRSAPLPALKTQVPTWRKASELARQWSRIGQVVTRPAGERAIERLLSDGFADGWRVIDAARNRERKRDDSEKEKKAQREAEEREIPVGMNAIDVHGASPSCCQ